MHTEPGALYPLDHAIVFFFLQLFFFFIILNFFPFFYSYSVNELAQRMMLQQLIHILVAVVQFVRSFVPSLLQSSASAFSFWFLFSKKCKLNDDSFAFRCVLLFFSFFFILLIETFFSNILHLFICITCEIVVFCMRVLCMYTFSCGAIFLGRYFRKMIMLHVASCKVLFSSFYFYVLSLFFVFFSLVQFCFCFFCQFIIRLL